MSGSGKDNFRFLELVVRAELEDLEPSCALPLLRLSGVDSSSGLKSSKSESSLSLVCCTIRSILGCRGRRRKLASANIEVSIEEVPWAFIADGWFRARG